MTNISHTYASTFKPTDCYIYIGIDPDVDKSGVAVWDKSNKTLELYNMTMPELIDKLKRYNSSIYVVIEAGWLINKSNWHTAHGQYRREKIAKNVGENHASGKIIEQFCKHLGISYELMKPKGKIDQQTFKNMTKVIKRTNQEQRDAAMLVYGM